MSRSGSPGNNTAELRSRRDSPGQPGAAWLGALHGPTFRVTLVSFVVSLVVSVPVALLLRLIAPGADVRLLALAMTASSLGVMVPILRDAGEITTEFGQLAIVAGSVGEFAALLLLTVLFSAQPEPTWAQVAYVLALGAAAVIGAFALRRMWRSAWLRRQPASHRPDDFAAAGSRRFRDLASFRRHCTRVRRRRPAGRVRRREPGRSDDTPGGCRPQESKPRPARSSVRSHRLRLPSRRSALVSDHLVSWTPAERSGSGGNGMGLVRTISSSVSSVGSPASRSIRTRPAKRLAPTPSPV